MFEDTPTIVVIGCGVIGLSCALRVQEMLANDSSKSSWKVLIVSKEWPTSIPGAPVPHSVEYSSMRAGAHVRPIPCSKPQLRQEGRWLKETVAEFESIMRDGPQIGLTSVSGVEVFEAPSDEYVSQSKETFEAETGLDGYRILASSELPPGTKFGFEYRTFCINSPIYCGNLLRKFILGGGKTLRATLRTAEEASYVVPNVQFTVDASGIGFNDPKVYPIRGQIVLTDAVECDKTVTRQNADGTWNFIIPRFFNGGTVFGGTKEPLDWTTTPHLATRQRLLDGAKKLVPFAVSNGSAGSPKSISVIQDIVGRRPAREGGVRLEIQHPPKLAATGQKVPIIHAYGAGGRGYEMSWGIANDVAGLARSLLEGHLVSAQRPRL